MLTYLPEGHVPRPTDSSERALQKINSVLLDGVLISNNSSGSEYVASTLQQTGRWQAFQILTDTKFHTLTGNLTGVANTNSLSAVTLPAGLAIYGDFSAFRLHSGSVIAYRS